MHRRKNLQGAKNMKFKCIIYGLEGKIEKTFDTYSKACDYGMNYITEVDWTAEFEVKEN